MPPSTGEYTPLLSTWTDSGICLPLTLDLGSFGIAEARDFIEGIDGSHDAESQPEPFENRAELERTLLRKVDLRISLLVAIHILSYIDRSSAAAARLRGFEEDLGLENAQFANILSIFFVGYVLVQVPSNMLLDRIARPSVYLPCCAIVWGTISFGTGVATNYFEALIARFLLGIAEATFFPGTLFVISRWYKRSELSQRMSYLLCGTLLSSAFGALLASAILDTMDNVLGLPAWRWLFFVEGGLTILIGCTALSVAPDFPESKTSSGWLTPAEHALAKRRMVEDAANVHVDTGGVMAGLALALSDWKVWYLATAYFLSNIASSFVFYFPTLTATMGYGPTTSLLLCAPPWLVAAVWSLWFCKHSDKTQERCMHVVLPVAFAIVGFILSMLTMNSAVRYAALFLMTQSSSSGICFFAWVSSTVSNPPAKRAVALAFVNALSQGGNIVGSYVWMKEWGPTYIKSYTICSISHFLFMIMCLWFGLVLQRLNREMDLEDERYTGADGEVIKRWRYYL